MPSPTGSATSRGSSTNCHSTSCTSASSPKRGRTPHHLPAAQSDGHLLRDVQAGLTWAYKFSYTLDIGALLRRTRSSAATLENAARRPPDRGRVRIAGGRPGGPDADAARAAGARFEPACLEFEKNAAASATASSVQVREKIHARSVDRWGHFEQELRPLKNFLEEAGIATG